MKFLNKIFGRGSENQTQQGSDENSEVADSAEQSPPSVEPIDAVETESPVVAEAPDPLAQARACREAGQLRDSVGHYQQYLRSFIEAPILEELAEVFEELGEVYMASSSRMIADSLKNKV